MKKIHTKLYEWQQASKTGEHNCCNCERTDEITVDHIISCAIIEQFFFRNDQRDNELRYYWLYNNEQNFRYLCKYCGSKKAHYLDFTEPLTKQLLLELLKLV